MTKKPKEPRPYQFKGSIESCVVYGPDWESEHEDRFEARLMRDAMNTAYQAGKRSGRGKK